MLKTIAVLATFAALGGGLSMSAYAIADAPRTVDIAAGDLRQALLQVSEQFGADLVYSPEQVQGIKTRGARGELTTAQAITKLLDGTPLELRTDWSGAILIAPPVAPKSFPLRTSAGQAGVQDKRKSSWSRLRLAQAETAASVPEEGRSNEARRATPTAEQSNEAAGMTEVIVTGTSLRGVMPAGSATVAIGLDELKSAGIANPAELQKIVPQLVTSNYIETSAASNSNSPKGTSFNLRGLGAPATLVLVDGRRVVPNGTSTPYADANNIPLVAVSRVEVVTDGASAIYGADAVGGVVNFILEKNFDGLRLNGRYNTRLGQDSTEVTGGAGHTWEIGGREGHAFGSLSWQTRDNLPRSASPYLSLDLRRFGGNDNRIANGTTVQAQGAGTLAVASTTPGQILYYSLPANKTSGITFADLTPGLGNIAAEADRLDYLGEERRVRGSLVLTQDLNSWLTGSLTGLYNKRDVDSYGTNFSSRYVSISIAPSSPYYIQGIPNSRGNQFINREFDPFTQHVTEELYNGTASLEARLPGNWRGEFWATYGESRTCGNCFSDEVINQAATTYVNRGLINPYGPLPRSEQNLARGPRFDRGVNHLTDFVLKFDGPLFDVPAGAIRAAVGGEFNRPSFEYGGKSSNTPDASFVPPRPATSGSREVAAFFSEVNIPLIAPEQELGIVRALNLNLAGRYEDYSDVGTATSPKAGATIEFGGGVTLRGNWGKSFRAPTLQEVNPGTLGNTFFQSFPNAAGDPSIPVTDVATGRSTILLVAGGNPGLEPEKATTYSFGLDYRPEYIPGLSTALTYYSIEYTSKIDIVPSLTFLANAANRALYAPYIMPLAPQPSTCVATDTTTFSDQIKALITLAPYRDAGTPGCNVVAFLDGRSQNVGKTTQTGIDLQADYRWTTGVGDFTTGARLTKILKYEIALLASSPFVDRLDQLGFPVGMKGFAFGSWTRGPVNTTLGLNYVGSYTNNLPITVNGVLQPVRRVPSWTTFDINASVQLPEVGWMKDSVVALSVQNVTDRDPPLVLSGSNAFDVNNANPYGRMFQIELSKSF